MQHLSNDIIRKRIRVYGVVQGVGFRPTTDRLAHEADITGTVANCGPYVEIIAEGTSAQIDTFLHLLRTRPPKRAAILKIDVRDAKGEQSSHNVDRLYTDFSIIESAKTSGEIFISPDIAICDDCKRELFDPKNRRYLHPFINCTCCGPRLTILESLPYDRERTSMKNFPMCDKCAEEYHDPASRRYDAQPVCCNDCGPEVYILHTRVSAQGVGDPYANSLDIESNEKPPQNNRNEDGTPIVCDSFHQNGKPEVDTTGLRGPAAITYARRVLSEGGILAVKGIGGFHLACDATSDKAIARLRQLKTRPAKPFAVMLRDETVADRECEMTAVQREILTGHQKPILLLPKKNGGRISALAAPDVPTIGVMLPYAPVQLLLFQYDDDIQMPDALVMTSGNVSGAPIARNDAEALEQLGGMCDAILSNNRPIRTRADDSVMDFYQDSPYMIRRSRGYAPLPYMLSLPDDTVSSTERQGEDEIRRMNVLAVGGELKNTFCLGINNIFYPSSYIGDLADIRTVNALKETIERMETLLEMRPDVVVCDLHPKYNSTAVAREIAKKEHLPLVQVQHHYAHVMSCMAENDVSNPVIGVSYDGTGYGTDGTIWGGEIMVADYHDFRRMASIVPFLQIGGDAAAKEGWRIAVSMILGLCTEPLTTNDPKVSKIRLLDAKLQEGNKEKNDTEKFEVHKIVAALDLCTEQETTVLEAMYANRMNAVESTSAGRLFDAVSAILGIRRQSSYEGEAATMLMYAGMEYRNQMGEDEAIQKDLHDLWEELRQHLHSEIAESDPVENTKQQKDTLHTIKHIANHGSLRTNAVDEEKLHRIPTDQLVRVILLHRLAGEDAGRLAYFFHAALAEITAREVSQISKETGIGIAALSGGVFQNKLLLELTEDALQREGVSVIRHHLIPPNDGDIALGQAVYGEQWLVREQR